MPGKCATPRTHTLRTIKRIEREYFWEPLANGVIRKAVLRMLPTQVWKSLIAALPICQCGDVVSPARAVRGHVTCGPGCSLITNRKKAQEEVSEREALAESIGQI